MRFVLAGVLVWLLLPPPASAQTPREESDAFFKTPKVVPVNIELERAEAESLRREPRKYVKVTLKVGDKTYKDVGVHLKGAAGSWRDFDDKPGLTLNMDKFDVEQRFHGMDKFHLSNSLQDPTYIQELVCGEMFRAAGVPASRINFAVVSVNGRKRGLYYLKEGYDSYFLKRHFGNNHGNFYDGGFLRDIDQPLQLVSGKQDVGNHADLKALVAAAREPDHAKRIARLEKVLTLDKFISYMALEAVMWDWDGYPFKANNYRIYHDPEKDKITFIPSGMDQMFGDVNGPIVPGFGGLVARKIMETPEGRKRYLTRLAELMKTVYRTDELVKRIDALEKVVQPVLAGIDAGAGRDYKNHVNRFRQAIVQREKSVNEQLKQMRK
jgi:spore coat protein CotH